MLRIGGGGRSWGVLETGAEEKAEEAGGVEGDEEG